MDDLLTISDLVADALDLSPAQVTDLSLGAPLVMRLPVAYSSNGTVHKYSKETQAPVVGFRAENAGRDWDSSIDTVVSITLKILDFQWAVDAAVARAWRRGSEDLIAMEGLRHLRAALFAFEKQIINGTTGGDAAGFAGFRNAATLDALADAQVVNAAGTTAATASSVYLIREGLDAVAGVMIEENPIEIGITHEQAIDDGTGKKFNAFVTPGESWCGVQVGGAWDIVRIVNLTADSGKGLTDDLIYKALETFPGGRVPTVIVGSRRSRQQLRESRTATNATGAAAPIPMEVEGIPFITSESILNTEALIT